MHCMRRDLLSRSSRGRKYTFFLKPYSTSFIVLSCLVCLPIEIIANNVSLIHLDFVQNVKPTCLGKSPDPWKVT